MTKNTVFMRDEIRQWRKEELVSEQQAKLLLERYPTESDGMDWGRVVPTAAGVVIFGLGVILFFAYNWADMHRFVKLAFIGTSLIAAHATAVWFGHQDRRQWVLSESLHLLGTLLFGAGIWLIAQIYHIDEHYPNAFLLWSVAALSLAWMIPSRMHALLALALAFLWGCFEIFDFNEAQHPANWLVAFGVIPLAIILRSNIILFFSIAIFTLLHAFSLVNIEDDLVFPVLIMLASAMLAVAYLLPNESSFRPADILRRIGLFIWIVLVFIGTFAELEIAALASLPSEPMNWLYWGLPTALAIITWAWVLATTVRQQTVNRQIEAAAVLTVMLTVLLISIGGKGWSGVEWILFNLAFLVVGGVTLSRGLTELRWTLTALGTAMLATIVFARFMDLFDSLLARSAAFVVTGIVLFLIGQLYNRRKRQLVEAEQADV